MGARVAVDIAKAEKVKAKAEARAARSERAGDAKEICMSQTDMDDWTDKNGEKCGWYTPQHCKLVKSVGTIISKEAKKDMDDLAKADGLPAYKACCACGGGNWR